MTELKKSFSRRMRYLGILGFVLISSFFLYYFHSYALIQTWTISNASNYWCEGTNNACPSTNVEVVNGYAQLKYKTPDYIHDTFTEFECIDGGSCENQPDEWNLVWLTDHMEIDKWDSGWPGPNINASVLRQPFDEDDYTDEIVFVHFDDAAKTAQVFLDVAQGVYEGSDYPDDISRGENTNTNNDPAIIDSSVGPGFNEALEFDGADDANLDYNGSSTATNSNSTFDRRWQQRSVGVWFKTPDPGTRHLIYKEGGWVNGAAIWIQTNEVRCGVWDGRNDAANDMNMRAEAPIKADTWHHVLCVHDSGATNNNCNDGSYRMYLDGELVEDAQCGELTPANSIEDQVDHSGDDRICWNDGDYFLNGAAHSGDDYCLNGFELDDFGVWNQVLVEADAQALYGVDDPRLVDWALEEASGTIQDSGNWNHDSTTETNVLYSQLGQFGSGISVDNNGYIEIATADSLEYRDTLTLMAWINPNTIDSSIDYLFDLNAANTDIEFAIDGDGTDAKLYATIDDGTNSDNITGVADITTAGGFFHVALVIDGSNARFFVNGVLDSIHPYSANLVISGPASLRVGNNDGGSSGFRGVIDEVIVAKRAYTATEMRRVGGVYPLIGTMEQTGLNSGSGTTEWRRINWVEDERYGDDIDATDADLTLLWHIDETSGQTVGAEVGSITGSTLGTTYIIEGVFDKARYFDEDASIVQSSGSIASMTDYTMELWVRFEKQVPLANEVILNIVGRDPMLMRDTNGNILVITENDLATPEITSTYPLTDKRWHHLAIVNDSGGGTLTLYIDGKVAGSGLDHTSSNADLYLGDDGGVPPDAFDGAIDEVAIYDNNLSGATLLSHYNRGANQLKALFRSCNDAGCVGEDWEGPDGNAMFGAHTYSNLVARWLFNETTDYDGTLAEVVDETANNNDGRSFYAWNVRSGVDLLRAIATNGASAYVRIPDDNSIQVSPVTDDLTLEAWLYMEEGQADGATVISKQYSSGGTSYASYALAITEDGRVRMRLGDDDETVEMTSDTPGLVTVGEWVHVVAEYDGAFVNFYVNGVADGVKNLSKLVLYDWGDLYIGHDKSLTHPGFKGLIDNVAIYDTLLGASEALVHYNLYNPSNYFEDGQGVELPNIGPNQYFDYKFVFYSRGDTGLSLSNVGILNEYYSTADPTIEIKSAQRLEYEALSSFTETLGPDNAGSVRYLIKEESDASWSWYNPSAGWETSNGTWAEASPAATINTNIGNFDTYTGTGYVLWRALLHSPNGTEQVQLDTISMEAPNIVNVDTPSGALLTVSDTTATTTWSFLGDVTNVDISWTINGAQFTDLALGVDAEAGTNCADPGPNQGCYQFTVPDAIDTDFQIHIHETGDESVNGISPDNTVQGDLSITSPAPPVASESYIVDDTLTVKWIVSGSVGLIDDTVIEIDSEYAGSNYTDPGHTIEVSNARNDNNGFACVPPSVATFQFGGCYEFPVPDEITADYDARIRVTDGAHNDESDDFRITGSLSMLTPIGTNVWKVETANDMTDTPLVVSWNYAGGVGTLDLDLSPDGTFGAGTRTVKSGIIRNTNNGTSCSAPNDGGCVVLAGGEVPQATETTGGAAVAKFRLTATTPDPDVVSPTGPAPAFEIRGWYDVTTPLSNTTWLVGANENLVWNTHGDGLGNYDIHYRTDTGSWQPVVTNRSTNVDDGDSYTYPWNPIPNETCAGPASGCDKMKIRIQQAGGGFEDITDNFTIKPTVTITDPVAKDFLIGNTSKTIGWTTSGTVPGNINIYYSTDQQWDNSCVASTGAGKCSVCSALSTEPNCQWSSGVPDTPSESVGFRAESADDPDNVFSVTGTNDNVIHGKFTASTPACAPNCFSEDEAVLTWSESTGSVNIPTVDIFWTVPGAAWTKINDLNPTPNDGLFNSSDSGDGGPFIIPEAVVHDDITIRVMDAQQLATHSEGISSGFAAPAKLRVISPNTALNLEVGDAGFDISWASQGQLTNTGIEISYCDDGATCSSPVIIADNLHPYTNNGTACGVPIVSAPEQAGCWRWIDGATSGIADLRGTQFRIRIEDNDVTGAVADCTPEDCTTARPDSPDISDVNFKIMPKLRITAPNGGQQLDAQTTYSVDWTSQGTPLANVNLLYSPNGGLSFPFDIPAGGNPTLSNSTAGGTSNSFDWTTPVIVSTGTISFKVKVKDPDDTNFDEAEDDSDAVFDIVARFDPTAPTGGQSWPVLTNQLISWNSFGAISTIQVEYWDDTISNWTTILQDTPTQGETDTDAQGKAGNASQFTWKVPNIGNIIDNNTTKFRIIDAVAGHVLRTTPVESNTISLVANLQMIDPPEAGENWRNAQTRVIRWKQVGDNDTISNVALEYSTDADANPNTFDSPQTIDLTALHGTNPDNGGCSLLGGLESYETEGCYAWTISGFAADDTSVYFRVRDIDVGNPASENAAGNGVSSVFTIYEGSTLTVDAPDGQTYNVDDNVDVRWTGTGDMINDSSETIDIYYTTVNSPTYPADYTLWSSAVDADSATNGCALSGSTGCIQLSAPDAIDTDFRFYIVDADDEDVNATSNTNTINGSISLNSPAQPTASETYVVGDTMTVTWTTFGGTIGLANDTRIEIDTAYAEGAYGAGASGHTIVTSGATNDNNGFGCVPPSVSPPQYGGCYEFPIPDELTTVAGGDARVRVSENPSGFNHTSESDDFVVTGRLTLTKPTALDVWKTESALDINDASIFVKWSYQSENMGLMNLDFDATGNFSGSERTVASGLVHNTNNSTSCSVVAGEGCVVLAGANLPDATELTGGSATAKFRLTADSPLPDVVSSLPATPAFEVRGWYNITIANAATVWSVGASENIVWETHGNGLGNIDIDYKIDAGNWVNIVNDIADVDGNNNTHNWTSIVNASCSGIALGCAKVKLRVKQTGSGTILDESDNFTIKPGLTMLDPAPLNFQIADTTPRTVHWTVTGDIFTNVNVYYSTDQQWENSCQSSTGAGKCLVCSALAVATTCDWPSVPDTPSETIKFLVEAVEDTDIEDENTNFANIHGNYTVNLPACAPNCYSEDETNLTWSETTGSTVIANVDIYYYDGAAWQQINALPTPDDGIFNSSDTDANAPWRIPAGLILDNSQIRVVDTNDSLLDSAGLSATFQTPVKFRMITPNAAEELTIGTTYDISWGYQGTVSNVTILACLDGTITCGSPGILAANAVSNTNNGTACTVPTVELGPNETGGCIRWVDATTTGVDDIRGTQLRVFIRDNDTDCLPNACGTARPKVDDGADNNSKAQVDLGLVQPIAPGLKIDAATPYNVEWDSQGTPLATVNLLYSNNGGSTFPFAVPSGGNPTANVTQAAPPSSPNNTLAWTTPNTVSTSTIKYQVRVEDPDDTNYPNAFSESGNNFDLVARFDPTAPTGGQSWPILTNQVITWDSFGTVSEVRVQYDLTAGGSFANIVQETPTQSETQTDATGKVANAGTFTWKVPNIGGVIRNGTVIFQIVDADTGHILRDTQPQTTALSTVANLAVTQPPEGGVNWRATQTRTIRWKQRGHNDNLTNVTLEYSTDDDTDANTFDNPQNIATGINHGTNADNGGCSLLGGLPGDETEGCFRWVIPGALANDLTVYVRVKDNEAGHPDSTAVIGNGVSSVFPVYVNATLNVEAPLTDTFDVDDLVVVQWSGTGAITDPGETIDIYYDIGGGPVLWSAGVDADGEVSCTKTDLGCIQLNVPDAISAGAFAIRIEDADDPDIWHSAGTNTVDGKVEIQTPLPPSASETFVVGDTMTISWISFGTIGVSNNTQIEIDTAYSATNYADPGHTVITTAATNDNNGYPCVPPSVSPPQFGGCYNFPIPDEITTAADARVRITEGGYTSESDDFTVTGSVTLTKPTALDVWKTETALNIADNPIYVEWTYTGDIGNLKLDFDSTGDFAGLDLRTDVVTGIVPNTNNGGTCVAPSGGGCLELSGGELPQADELTGGLATAKFRLTADTPDPDVVSVEGSTPAFEVRGWYNVTAPTSSDTWLVQLANNDIVWETHGDGLGNVNVSYKVDTAPWVDIITDLADSDGDNNTYTWPSVVDAVCAGVPLGCDKVKIRVKQSVGSIEDVSDNFTIKPRVTITNPGQTNFQIAATDRTLAWTLNGTVSGNVNVYYSTDQQWGNSCVSSTGTGKCSVCSDTATNLSCDWASVPDTPSENVIFRAEAANDSTVFSDTSVTSSIHGSFTANVPACAPNCFSEDTTNLTWSEDTGSINIANVDIYYKVANGAWTKINALPTPSDGIFNNADTDANAPFVIPDTIVHDSVQIRVVDTNDTLLDSAGESSAFVVPAKVRMITPDGGEDWKIGDVHDIQWAHTGTITNVSLKYCDDGTTTCGTPNVIVASIAADNASGCASPSVGSTETAGCYSWQDGTTGGVADTRGILMKAFIHDEDTACSPAACSSARPKVDDAAADNFKIIASLATVAPVAASQLDANTAYNIRWNSQGTPLTNVDLMLSDNAGASFSTAIQLAEPNTSVAGSATLNTKDTQWTTPTLISDSGIPRDYVMRVRDPDTTNYLEAAADVSFDIVAKFSFTNPTSGNNLLVGKNYTLAWTTDGAVNNVQLAYTTPEPPISSAFQTIIQTGSEGGTPVPTATDGNNEAPNTGTFTWQVPDVAGIISTGAKLRLVDGDDDHVLRTTPDESQTFNILPAFVIVNPTGSEILDAGDTFNIQWKTLATDSAPTNIDIDFSTNGGGLWNGTVVTDALNGQNSGCTLPSVNPGETAGCYEWKMPGTAISGNVKVRVKDSDVGAPDSTADATNGVSAAFQIQEAILIVTPATNEQVTVGSDYDVQWEAYGSFANVALQYSDDDFGSNLTNITMNAGHAANGSCALTTPAAGGTAGCYQWNPIPNDIRPDLKLRLKEISGALREEITGTWEIVGPLSIVSPNGGATVGYDVGDVVTITWANNPLLTRETPIDLEYSVNGAAGPWNQVLAVGGGAAEGIDNSGGGPYTFDWEIPNSISTDVLVRIIKQNTPTIGDQSNNNFDITGVIDLQTLQSADAQYAVSDTIPIVFEVDGTSVGNLYNTVTVRYSTDPTFQTGVVNATETPFVLDHNGSKTDCVGVSAPYTCTFDWVPDVNDNISNSEIYYLQVVDPNQEVGASTSAFQFQIYGKLTLTDEHPCDVDNVCYISESPTIDFTKAGTANGVLFDFVNIQYSNDNFANHVVDIETNWALDATNCPSGNCSYTWNIDSTNTLSNTEIYDLRVIDPDNTVSVDTGTTSFEIAGNLALSILDSGDQIYKVGDTIELDFTKAGTANGTIFDNVVIQYSDQIDFSANVVNIDTNFLLNAGNCPANACRKNWLIDDSQLISATPIYYLRVIDPNNADSTTGSSQDQFEIRGNLVLTILTAGNQNYKVGDNVNITWEKDGAANGNLFNDVVIEYSDDGFANNTINITTADLSAECSGSFPNETCSYNWVLDNGDPIITAQNYSMRIIDPQNSDSVTTSTRQFKVAGDLELTILQGADDTYDIGENVLITWTAEGAANGTIFDNVDIVYSDDNFLSNVTIMNDYDLSACSGINCSHNWPIPGNATITGTAAYKFRVIDQDNPNDSVSTSINRFRLAGDLNLTTQLANVTYNVGQTVPITFEYDGDPQGTLFNDIHIQYSNNEFGGDTRDIALNQVLGVDSGAFTCDGGPPKNCTYQWTIPNTVTLTSDFDYRLRVVDPDNTDLSTYGLDLSGGLFKLAGGFTWNNPTGVEIWGVGTDRAVDWDTNGSISNVKVSYSTDNFVNEVFFDVISTKLQATAATTFGAANPITNTPNGNTAFTMVMPDGISSNFEIRVYDANDANVYMDSLPIKVHAVYNVTDPGVNTKIANTAYVNGVQWTTAGTVANSLLQYQLDGGAWTAIPAAESAGATDANGVTQGDPGSIDWTTPSAKAAATKVRVCTANGAAPDTDTCIESSTFKLSAKVTVTSPDGEQAPLWRVGETNHTVTWTTIPASLGNTNTVDISFSTQGLGGVFNLLAGGDDTLNNGTFAWNPIPDNVSDNVYIRVEDSTDASGKDESNASFSIAGDLQIEVGNADAPLGGELWPVYKAIPAALAQAQDITWTSTGTAMNQIDIIASNDGFSSSNVSIAAGLVNPVGQNTFSWQISDSVSPITPIGDDVWQIKIVNSAPGTPAEEVISNTFSIVAGMYMSTHNTLADRCLIGNVCTISWDTAGSVNDVTLEYSTDGDSGPWNLMHGGSTLGSNPGFINWVVPGGLTPQTDVRYQITDGVVGHPAATDMTAIDTKIVAEFPSANILLNPGSQPLSGRTFSVGESITVDYTYTSTVANVDVQYTLDQDVNPLTFDNPVTIISDEPTNGDGTGSFNYTFADLMAGGADVSRIQFRIVDSAVPDNDVANAINGVTGSFKLRGDITITAPNTGLEKWPVGSNQSITWTHTGASITNVTIEYDDNATFTSPTVLVGGTLSNATVGGTYNFTVNNTNFPDLNVLYHNDIFIRVSDADTSIHGNSNDKSDNGHMIIGVLDFTQPSHAPTLNEAWSLGVPHNIVWNTQGQITSVDVYYSDTGLFNDAVLINTQITSGQCNPGPSCTNTPDADNTFTWTPPTSSNVGVNSAIFVVDTEDNSTPQDPTYQVQGISPIFNLHGSVTYTGALLDGLKLKAGTQVTITWDTFGDALNNIDIEYSTDDDLDLGTFDNPQPVQMGHDNTGGNRGTYDWTIPATFNDGTVYLRINPAGSTAGEDVSGAFKIMPDIQLLAPTNGTEWEVGSLQDITWDITGVVANITLRYSVNDGGAYPDGAPHEIISLDPNVGGYDLTGPNARYQWTVEDTITQLGKMKIQLEDDPTGDADAEMTGNFVIESLFILNQPIANDEFEVGGNFNLNWDWSGTIPQIMIEISNTFDGVDPATFDTGAKCMDLSAPPCLGGLLLANGPGSSGTNYSPAPVAVPDWISRPGDPEGEFPFHIRISDPNNQNTWSIGPVGATGFKIKSNFDITAPDGAEHWFVGNADSIVTWTHTGTVGNVVLEYSDDNFVSNIYCVNGGTYPTCNSTTNANTYTWNIPDDETLVPWSCNTDTDPNPGDQIHPCMNDTVRVRVRDADDIAVLDPSAADFNARYVAKRWLLRDSVSGADLNSITMFDNSIHRIRAYANQSVLGIVSPYTIWSPSGTNYSIGFSKTGYNDFTDSAQTTTLTDQYTAGGEHFIDEEQEVFMQSTVAHNDLINTEYSYTAGLNGANDSITFKVWYSRDGLNVVTTTQANLRIYDNANTEVINLVSAVQDPANSGVYTFTISPSGLTTNVNYSARNLVTLASASQLEGYNVINLSDEQSQQVSHDSAATIKPLVDANLDAQLSLKFNELDTAISDLETEITGKIGDTSEATIAETMDATKDAIQDSLEQFREDSEDTINNMRDRIVEAAIRLIIPDTVKLGQTETLRIGTAEGVTPTLTLLCPDGTSIFDELSAPEIDPGIYGVEVEFSTLDFSCAAAKAITVIAEAVIPSADPSDPPFTATAIGSIFLTTTDLDTIQGLAAAGLNAEKAAKEAKDASLALGRALQGEGSVSEAIQNLQKTVGRLPSLISSNQGGVSRMRTTLNEVASKLNIFLGNEGVDLRTMLRAEVESNAKGVRNKMDRTLAATEVMKQVFEQKWGGEDSPIVETFFEIGSVKLRVIAVNPSDDKTQVVPIKIYLPKEVIPEDVIDTGDLSLGYDSGKGLYYAFNESIELQPQETRMFEVHIEDVWRIADEEINELRGQTNTALKHLEGTPYFDHGKVLVDSIHSRLDKIEAQQNDETVSREEHMGAYRVNVVVMDQIRADIKMLEKMLQYVGAPPAIEFLKDPVEEETESVDKIKAWYLIFGILGFLGIIAVGFYIRWILAIRASKRAPIVDDAADDGQAAPFISENIEDKEGGSSGPDSEDGGGSIPIGEEPPEEPPKADGGAAKDRNE